MERMAPLRVVTMEAAALANKIMSACLLYTSVGNYFGAMEPAVRMQESGESFYFLADYHAMSTVHDANALRGNCSNLATDFLAVGLDLSLIHI